MKKFLKKFFVFCIPLLLMWVCIELMYRLVPNNYSFKHQNIGKNFDSQILVFGNSHSFYGINPRYFSSNTFNISNISQSLYFDELLFNKYINDFKDLKTVVFNVDYFTLSTTENDAEDRWRRYFYKEQMHLDVPGISALDLRLYSLTFAPRFNLTIETIKQYFKVGTLVECSTKGWRRQDGVNELYNNAEMAKVIANKHEDGSVDFRKNVQRLKSIIAACNKRNINVILVNMPVTSNYAANVNQHKLALITKECAQLAKIENVYYLNLFQDNLFQDTDFYDTDHLNSVGAKKCSQLLDGIIANLKK